MNEKQEVEILKNDVFILNNKLMESTSIIATFKKESNKGNRIIYSLDPTKVSVDLNNELSYNRELASKLSKLVNVEKAKVFKMEESINNLKQENETLRVETCKCQTAKGETNYSKY